MAAMVLGMALLCLLLVACDSQPSPTIPAAPPTPVPAATATALPTPAAAATAVPTAPVPTSASTPTPTRAPAPTTVPATPTSALTPTPVPALTRTPAPEAPTDGDALALDPAVAHGTLSNGLVYYVRQNGEPRNRARLSLVVRAGSVLEEETQRGLAHFVEHMAFNGTERFAKQEIIDYLESIGSSLGGDLNAGTGFDSTAYWLEVPTEDPEVMETAFQVLSDWAYGVTFAPDEVEKERGVILEEWRLYQGFSSRLQEVLFPLLFRESRYADRNPIGLPEIIENAPVERLREYYDRWYRPDMMAVIAVGDFDAESIEASVKRHFAPPPEGAAFQERATLAQASHLPEYDVPGSYTPRVMVFTDPEAPGTDVDLVRTIPPHTGQDLAAYRQGVAEELSFMMFNSRLFELGQADDPPYLWAGAGRTRVINPLDFLVFSAGVERDGVERGLNALLEELQRVRRHGFTTTELAREKVNLRSSVEGDYQRRDQLSSAELARSYRGHFLTGRPTPGIETKWRLYQELLEQVSLSEVNAVAESWTEPGNTVLLATGPEGIGEGTNDELQTLIAAQLAQAPTLEAAPYEDSGGDAPLLATLPTPGSIVAEERIESIDARRWTLSNGVTVIAKQTDFNDDQVLFTAFSPGGDSLAPDADHVSAQHSASIAVGSGVGLHDRVTLDKVLAGKRVSVSPYIGELFEGFSGSASPGDLESLFQLITLYATSPRFDPTFFETYQSRLRTFAESRATQPDQVFFDTLRSVMSQHHFRQRPLTLDVLQELDLERAEAVYAERFADLGDSTFVFAGAFDWEELRSLAATYLASLPAAGRTELWRDVGIDPPLGLEDREVRRGIEPRSNTAVVFAGDMEWDREEALALGVAGEMLGLRLREQVREELGGTYSIRVSADSMLLPDPEYQVSIIFGSDPARADELFGVVLDEVEWLRSGGGQDYLDKVKEILRASREEQLRTNHFWTGQIEAALQRGEPLNEINRIDGRLETLTLEQVVEAAGRYLTPDRYIRVVLLPEDG